MRIAGQILGAVRAGGLVMLRGHCRTPGALVLGYHDVQPRERWGTSYTVSPEDLRQQLQHLALWGLSFVSLDSLLDRLDRGDRVDGLVSVTFDDALVGVHHYAQPIITEFGVPATIFPVARTLGDQPAFWPGSHRQMSAGELAELVDAGWTVGSHTLTHPHLRELEHREVIQEVRDSKSELEDLVSGPVTVLAYPFGEHDAFIRGVARESGYRAAFSFTNGRVSAQRDIFALPRLTMTPTSILRFAYHVSRPSSSWPADK